MSAGELPVHMFCALAAVPPTEAAVIVTFTAFELAAVHGVFVTTALYQRFAVSVPISALVNGVAVAPPIFVHAVSLFEYCHWIVPVYPLKVMSAGELPVHIVCAVAAVPPTEAAVIVTFTAFELAAVHGVFVTTALYQRFAVSVPISALVNGVAVAPPISVHAVSLFEYCHWIVPVYPLKLMSAGELPVHMFCALAAVPPTEVAVTVTVTEAQLVLPQPPSALT